MTPAVRLIDAGRHTEFLAGVAEQGDSAAQFKLGVVYFKGDGVPQDSIGAHKWVTLAAAPLQPSSVPLQHLSHLRRQIVDRERLLEEVHALIQHAVVGDDIGRIAGRE